MRSIPSRTFLGVVLASGISIQIASSQDAPAQAPPPQQAPQPSSPGPTGPGGPGQTPGQPGGGRQPIPNPGQQPFPSDRQQFPDMQQMRSFFFSGKVTMDDGTPPPEPVQIERVCNGMPRPEAWTDSKGRFSFQLGQNQAMMMDASVAGNDPMGGGTWGPGGMGRGGRNTITERDLIGCELRASLAGFRSDIVSLAGRRSLDNPDVGTIVLHRLAKVDGFTFSGTSLYAPKDAKKAYEKGREAAKKKKWEDAEKHLQKATSTYSQYAVAWYELGLTYQQQNKMEEARNAYEQAIKADGKYITPYAQMARIAASEKKWDEAVQHTDKVIRLNPYFSPEIYFLSGLANLNQNKLDAAEEHTREALKMDAAHRNPKISHLMGVILAQKQDYAGAAENMRAYLKYAPQASDIDHVKKQLEEVERLGNVKAAGAQQAQQ